MLQTMRDNSKGVVAGILVGLLVIIFALSGAEALFSTANNTQVALTVNGQEITETEVLRAVEQQKVQLRNRFGDSVPESFLSNENLRQPAIDRLIDRAVMIQAAESANMAISRQRIDDVIVSIPAFQNSAGQFDPEVFTMALRRLGYTPANYRTELSRDLIVNQLANGITNSGFATAAEVEYLAELNNQTRDFSYVTLTVESLLDEVEVSEAEIADYYKQNAEPFTEPEKVIVEYIDLSVERLMASEELSEAEIKSYFEENIDSFTPVVERHVAHILLEEASEAELAQVQAAIDSGQDFAELAQQYSDDMGSKDMGGDLGVTTGDAFPEEFEEALAQLNVGEVSAPVETDAGTHFIKLVDMSGGEAPDFDAERDSIAAQIKRARAEGRFVELLDRLEDLSYNAESLADVADSLGLEAQSTDAFSRNGGNGVAAYDAVVRAAFGEEVLEFGNSSELIELASDRVVVVKLLEREASFVKPLAEVQSDIRATLSEQKADEALRQRGDALVRRVESGEDLAVVASSEELELVEVTEGARSDTSQPRSVIEFAFSLPRPVSGSIVDGSAGNGEYHIVQLKKVAVPAVDMPEEQQQAMRQGVAGFYGSADFESFSNYLLETANIVAE
ncbi:SurA N-terminal domain-containing protein [Gilvimarinus chinensis]|uniref:SurA N-terminal domain-containing protein n=1 Tax=Gilvimarinus chinensis TaxID=396005 RepID=UPI00035D6546|nr:SurA N-terminal domain-containing protein [Gilvimarinus chinensis]